MEEDMNRLKNKIKASLAKEGYTLADLAARMEVSPASLSTYIKGNMKMHTAFKIADALVDMTGCHLTLNDFRKDEQ